MKNYNLNVNQLQILITYLNKIRINLYMIINNMTITAYSVLLIITLAIFLFCYFVATRVWIKVDEQNRKISPETKKKRRGQVRLKRRG